MPVTNGFTWSWAFVGGAVPIIFLATDFLTAEDAETTEAIKSQMDGNKRGC